MAASLSGSVNVILKSAFSETQDIGSKSYAANKNYNQAFANGTGINQANQIWTDTRTISGSSNDDIDLAGVLTDVYGTTLTFTSIKAIIINSLATNGNALNVGAGTNPFLTMFGDATDIIVVRPGGTFAIINPEANGYAVTASTGDILRIANADASDATYDIIIIGEI